MMKKDKIYKLIKRLNFIRTDSAIGI